MVCAIVISVLVALLERRPHNVKN